MKKQFSTSCIHKTLPGDNGTLIWPFSPPVYQTELTPEQVTLMLEHGAQCDDNWEQNLAGEMHTGGSFHFREEHIQHWEPILRERVLMAMAGLAMTHQGALNPKEMLQIPSGETRSSKRTGELYLESLWINYQREGDNKPVHIHSGEVSMVIFLDVPEHIFDNTNSGKLSFYYGENTSYWHRISWTVDPYDGLMFVFPANLRHGVTPFRKQGCRVSVSGNWRVR